MHVWIDQADRLKNDPLAREGFGLQKDTGSIFFSNTENLERRTKLAEYIHYGADKYDPDLIPNRIECLRNGKPIGIWACKAEEGGD